MHHQSEKIFIGLDGGIQIISDMGCFLTSEKATEG